VASIYENYGVGKMHFNIIYGGGEFCLISTFSMKTLEKEKFSLKITNRSLLESRRERTKDLVRVLPPSLYNPLRGII